MTGGRIDTDRAFVPLGIAVLTISDSRNKADDSGDLLVERVTAAGHVLQARALVTTRPRSRPKHELGSMTQRSK